jgi:phosphoadenosine phosphosulfate reductase
MTSRRKIRAYWCDRCQVPVLGVRCHCCGEKTRDISSATFSPVFRPEIAFLKKNTFPEICHNLQEIGTWANYNSYQYYSNGKPVLKLGNKKDSSKGLNWNCLNAKVLSKRKTRKQLLEDIRKANAPYVERMQYEAEKFIRQTASQYQDKTLVVSFSGGKDSTVVSHLVMNALGRSDILHMFADTTIEFPDTYKYIEDFQRQHPLTPFVAVRSSLDFFETAENIGPPSRILRWCCTTHKTNPLAKFINGISPDSGVLAFDGIRKSESHRRSNYSRVTKEHKIVKEFLASPILEWSDFHVWIYILYHNLNFNAAYRKGFRRVGCLYCPFNSDWSFKMINSRYPQKSAKWNNFLLSQAKHMKHPNPEIFANYGWRSRAGGRGLEHYKTQIESTPCKISDSAISYQILSGEIKNVRHIFRPFGPQSIIKRNGYSEAFIIHDVITQEMMANVEVAYEDRVVRINYFLPKKRRLFQQRIEKQLKKLQSCIACGACSAKCPKAAILYDKNFVVDPTKCTSCLKCVLHNCPALESLKIKGKAING